MGASAQSFGNRGGLAHDGLLAIVGLPSLTSGTRLSALGERDVPERTVNDRRRGPALLTVRHPGLGRL